MRGTGNTISGGLPRRPWAREMLEMAAAGIAASLVLGVAPSVVRASDVSGTVEFEGQVVFAAPVAGIDAEDLTIGPKATAEATGPGETCTIQTAGTDNPDADGTYPGAAGAVTATILLSRNGPNPPSGDCLVTIQAGATDGVSVSARGSRLLFVTLADIGGNATIAVPDITVRESKAVAGLDTDCFRWVKRQFRKRRACNIRLLRLGDTGADRCTDAGLPPAGCDTGLHVPAMLALSHGGNDQQTSPGTAVAIDVATLRPQLGCQRRFGAAALGFAFKRLRLVRRRCVDSNADSADCRDQQSQGSKRPLDRIDGCSVDQLVDGMSGLAVPDTGDPCDACIDGAGVIDRKCLKGCYQVVLDELTDGIVGDVPVCGNGILQPGEFCDDGNTTPGDCCSDTCMVETPGVEGPMGDPTCTNGIDDDCDGDVDGADLDCQ